MQDMATATKDVDEEAIEASRLEKKAIRLDQLRSAAVVVAMIVFSLIMAGVLKDYGTDSLPNEFRFISAGLGWLYFAAWSVSFYPQAILNCSRHSTAGMSQDYQLYNLIGFFCYSVFNCAFFFNETVQQEYRIANNGHSNQVQLNDVFFALHALLLTVIIVAQIFIYDKDTHGTAGRITLFAAVLTGGTFGIIVLFAILVLAGIDAGGVFTWLNWLYMLSYVKLGVTLVKYIPQAYLNWYRRTTDGFNMHNVLLDFTGGSLSVAQLLLDSGVTSDWAAVTGDLAKFMLGFVSMVFDIVFMLQHYCCFHARNRELLQRRLVLERMYGAKEASRLLAAEEIRTLISMQTVRDKRGGSSDATGANLALTGGYGSVDTADGQDLLVAGEDASHQGTLA